MFAEERPALRPLPVEPFRYYRYGERTVHLDGCVEVEAAYYGAPPGWIGQRVQVQWNDLHVRLLAPKTGQLLREHLRAPRGWHRIARRRSAGAHAGDHARAARRAPAPPARTSTRSATHIHAHEGARRRPSHPRRARARQEARRRPSSTTPPRPRSSSACRPIASSAAISNAGRRRR